MGHRDQDRMKRKALATKERYPFYRDMCDDSESFYRATMYAYLERLILKGPEAVRSFLALY